jgi:hypothetical protein
VVDVRYDAFDVYIGRRAPRAGDPRCHRGSAWANPFALRCEWERGWAVEAFEGLMRSRLAMGGVPGVGGGGRESGEWVWWTEERWRAEVLAIAPGARLGCWCKGKRGRGACHGDVIVRLWEELRA